MTRSSTREWAAPLPTIAVFVFLILPWLNPFSPGPSPSVMPWLLSLGCFALVLLWAARVPLAKVAATAWLTAALLSAVLGLLQYFGATAPFGIWVNNPGIGEAFANLRQRNQFATLINMGLAALMWWVAQDQAASPDSISKSFMSRRRAADSAIARQGETTTTGMTWKWNDSSKAEVARSPTFCWRSLAALPAAVLLAFANAASSSRTGLVQLLLLSAMVWVWSRSAPGANQSARLRLLWVAVLAYGIAALTLPVLVGHNLATNGILARLHDGGPTCASRLTLWTNVLHLIGQKPWFGWGWGELDFAHFITLYPDLRFCEILDNAHNLPLHLAVELGLPVAVAVCAGAVWLTLRARPWRESDATRQLAWAVLAVIVLHSLLEYPLWYGPFQMAFGLSLWLLWRRRGQFPAGVVAGSSVLAIGLIAIAAYAAWDYQRISQIYLTPSLRSPAFQEDTLEKIGTSRLFQNQVNFAELTTTALTRANAAHLNALAETLLHFSPEPRVIETLIESAALLGRLDEAQFYQLRYRAAFPESYANWVKTTH